MDSRNTTTVPDVFQCQVAEGNSDTNRIYPINKIVIHSIVGSLESATARFNNPEAKVSTHYGIGLDGRIIQWVPEDHVAYANSNYTVNQSAISIEHEDNGDSYGPRTDILYQKSAQLVHELCTYYELPINRDIIIRHREVPAATACPAGLDIDRIVREAQAIQTPSEPPVETISLDKATFEKLVKKSTNFDIVAGHYHFSEAEAEDPKAGERIVEIIVSTPLPTPPEPPRPPDSPTEEVNVVVPREVPELLQKLFKLLHIT